MYKHVDKSRKNNRAVANSDVSNKDVVKQSFHIDDNRTSGVPFQQHQMVRMGNNRSKKGGTKKKESPTSLSHDSIAFVGNAMQMKLEKDKFNVAGEKHDESDKRRKEEMKFCKAKTGVDDYWTESEFYIEDKKTKKRKYGDPIKLRIRNHLLSAIIGCELINDEIKKDKNLKNISLCNSSLEFYITEICDLEGIFKGICNELSSYYKTSEFHDLVKKDKDNYYCVEFEFTVRAQELKEVRKIFKMNKKIDNKFITTMQNVKSFLTNAFYQDFFGSNPYSEQQANKQYEKTIEDRSKKMHNMANSCKDMKGVWKIGDNHREDMEKCGHKDYNLISIKAFDKEMKVWVFFEWLKSLIPSKKKKESKNH
jgi:hypothetical protein